MGAYDIPILGAMAERKTDGTDTQPLASILLIIVDMNVSRHPPFRFARARRRASPYGITRDMGIYGCQDYTYLNGLKWVFPPAFSPQRQDIHKKA